MALHYAARKELLISSTAAINEMNFFIGRKKQKINSHQDRIIYGLLMCNCRRHLMMGDWRRRGESLCWLVDLIQTRTSNKMWSFKSFSELIYDQCVTFSCSINQPHISHLHRPIWATCTSFPPPPSPADCSLNEIKWLRGSFWEIQSQMTATNVLLFPAPSALHRLFKSSWL